MIWVLSNWRPLMVLGLVVGLGVYGLVMRLERDTARAELVELLFEAERQQERARAVAARQRQVTEEANRAYKARIDRLAADNSRLARELRELAAEPVLSAVPPAADAGAGGEGGDRVVCFARERLSRAIEAELAAFAERYSAGVQAGALAIAGFEACASWALEVSAAAAGVTESVTAPAK